MRLISDRTLDRYAEEHADVREQLALWRAMVLSAKWTCGDELVRTSLFPARALPNRRAVFNIKGNDYRIVCSIQYADPARSLNGIVRLQFLGTHAEYSKVDAQTVALDPRTPRDST